MIGQLQNRFQIWYVSWKKIKLGPILKE
jgi:hypothetical protein